MKVALYNIFSKLSIGDEIMINLDNKSNYDTRITSYGGAFLNIPKKSTLSLKEDYNKVSKYYKPYESIGIFCYNAESVQESVKESEKSVAPVKELIPLPQAPEVLVPETEELSTDRRFYERLNKAKLLEISVQLGTDYNEEMSRKELIDLIMKVVRNENR